MTRAELLVQVGRRLRDTSQALYSKELLSDGFDKAIDRIKQEVKALRVMVYFENDTTEVEYLPEYYHEMLGVYAVFHAFAMDERHYESQLALNEFEAKLATLREEIESGEITITDKDGNEVLVPSNNVVTKVTNNYFRDNHYDTTNDGRWNANDYNTAGDGETVQG